MTKLLGQAKVLAEHSLAARLQDVTMARNNALKVPWVKDCLRCLPEVTCTHESPIFMQVSDTTQNTQTYKCYQGHSTNPSETSMGTCIDLLFHGRSHSHGQIQIGKATLLLTISVWLVLGWILRSWELGKFGWKSYLCPQSWTSCRRDHISCPCQTSRAVFQSAFQNLDNASTDQWQSCTC